MIPALRSIRKMRFSSSSCLSLSSMISAKCHSAYERRWWRWVRRWRLQYWRWACLALDKHGRRLVVSVDEMKVPWIDLPCAGGWRRHRVLRCLRGSIGNRPDPLIQQSDLPCVIVTKALQLRSTNNYWIVHFRVGDRRHHTAMSAPPGAQSATQ